MHRARRRVPSLPFGNVDEPRPALVMKDKAQTEHTIPLSGKRSLAGRTLLPMTRENAG
jgi:hypothetical protein